MAGVPGAPAAIGGRAPPWAGLGVGGVYKGSAAAGRRAGGRAAGAAPLCAAAMRERRPVPAAPARCKLVLVGDVQCGKTAMLQVLAKDCYPEVSRSRHRAPGTGSGTGR